jgi:hypothetical protein
MALPRKNATQSNPTQTASKPAGNSSYPTGQNVTLPRKPIGAVLVNIFLKISRFVFSPEFAVICGYGLAFGSVIASIGGYYAVLNGIFGLMKLTPIVLWGINLPALAIGGAFSLIVQYKELAPRQFKLFPHRADMAAWKAGRDIKVNPKETEDTPSMLPTYKLFARQGDSMAHADQQRDSFVCYVFEGIGALVAIGKFLGNANPIVQLGAVVWAAYSVYGCEFGLGHAEGAASRIMSPEDARDYLTEKERLRANATP